jgi:hypothetical protein
MKKIIPFITLMILVSSVFAQTDKDQLALSVSKAEDQNLAKLKEYIWKRSSKAFVDNQLKLTTVTEFSFDQAGKLVTNVVDAETTVKQKPGLRGAVQKNAAEDKMDYIEKALGLSLKYAFMTKGELIDFFDKATITEKDGLILAEASNVYLTGDKLLVKIDPATHLFVYKEFSSLLGQDPVDGKLSYDKFSNGTMHGTTTILNMPAQKMKIEGTNQDYTVRVN